MIRRGPWAGEPGRATCRSVLSRVLGVCFGALLPAAAGAAQTGERLYAPACEQGDFIACNVLGLMYETGEGVARDRARAAELYELACQGGALVGCTNLGLAHELGLLGSPDVARAVGLYHVACEGGEPLGCERLRDHETDPEAPVRGFEKVARVGDVSTGEPLARAVVDVPALAMQLVTDGSGRVTIPGLATGRHLIRVDREGYEPLVVELDVPGAREAVVLLERASVANPRAPGRLVGRVLDESGQPLANVEVTVLAQPGARTLTNPDGRFILRDVEQGLAEVRFSRLGYAPRTATLVVHPERTVEISTSMVTDPIELEPIQVIIRSAFLERTGFYERADGGWGLHFTPHDLEIIDAIATSEIVRWRVPGVRLEYSAQQGVMQVVTRRGGSIVQGDCVLPVYVDGVRSHTADIDQVPPQHLEAIEIFNGVSTPIEYSAGPNTCGAVMLWTRRGN